MKVGVQPDLQEIERGSLREGQQKANEQAEGHSKGGKGKKEFFGNQRP